MSYKETLEEFMSNHNGTSLSENYIIVSISPLLTFYVTVLVSFLYAKLTISRASTKAVAFFIEFSGLIFPLILCCTVLESYHHILLSSLLAFFVLVSSLIINKAPRTCLKTIQEFKTTEHRAFISYFRSILGVYTAICILAVDFKIFPRRFAKTETFGYGLMDTGVGFYIVANSIVARRLPSYYGFGKSVMSSLPIFVLGLFRLYSVSSFDYQNHVTEYGVHWNFFFTLGFIKLLSPIFTKLHIKTLVVTFLALLIGHQFSLGFFGLQEWVLADTPRSNLLTANREGIVSLPGYVSLFVFGLILGQKIRQKFNFENEVKNVITLFMWFIICLVLTIVLEYFFNTSRRLANATYVVWIISLCFLVLSITMIVELCLSLHFCVIGLKNFEQYLVPSILESINYNSLLFFLVANLLTGIVNILYQTLNANPIKSLMILIVYMFTTCLLMNFLRVLNIKVKF